MNYQGEYKIFDTRGIKTHPVKIRKNKVTYDDVLSPDQINTKKLALSSIQQENIRTVAEHVIEMRKGKKPVLLFSGAHLIKNGLGRLLIDLIHRDLITLIAGNSATTIHDFELALIGQTSEDVPLALEKGEFGMAYEFIFQNAALSLGNELQLGYGESLGRMICDPGFRDKVLARLSCSQELEFQYSHISVLAACFEKHIPFTVHAGIGTDVIDQHPSFDGQAKGGCSGRDFLVYAHEITRMTKGGMLINIGSAVTGPEVFLKAASMAANIGKAPHRIITADFDLRPFDGAAMSDESKMNYYFRDQKSIVTRVPQAYHGQGYYIQGNQKETFPYFYQQVINLQK